VKRGIRAVVERGRATLLDEPERGADGVQQALSGTKNSTIRLMEPILAVSFAIDCKVFCEIILA
jgi:hypothetical protein